MELGYRCERGAAVVFGVSPAGCYPDQLSGAEQSHAVARRGVLMHCMGWAYTLGIAKVGVHRPAICWAPNAILGRFVIFTDIAVGLLQWAWSPS